VFILIQKPYYQNDRVHLIILLLKCLVALIIINVIIGVVELYFMSF